MRVGDGNRIFQLNYNLHTDDDWKENSGSGGGNHKDNTGNGNSGNSGNSGAAGADTGSQFMAAEAPDEVESEPSLWTTVLDFFGLRGEETEITIPETETIPAEAESESPEAETTPAEASPSDAGITLYAAGGNGNTNNTYGSQNQSGILFPEAGEVSELDQELIDRIKTTGKQKNYELVEYVNDVNQEYTEVLMELNINGIMDTAYSYGNERLTNERFTEWTGYYTYDPRGSVSGITDKDGYSWQSYRYDAFGNISFGQPQYNNVYGYNAESYNPNLDGQYLRARYYCPTTADFFMEDSYLGDITDPLTLNRYSYVKSSPLNFIDPSGHLPYAASKQEQEEENFGIPYSAADQGNVDSRKHISADNACAQVSAFINSNAGALIGGAAGVAVIMLTAPASAPVLVVMGASMTGGAVGMVAGGTLDKGIDSAVIAEKLKHEYGVNVTEQYDLEMDELPQEVQELYEAGFLLESIQGSVSQTSRKKYAKLTEGLKNKFKSESKSMYLETPKKGGVLNIGAGTKPIENAYNIDINPSVNGVHQGSVNDLSNRATGSQNKVIMQNPYKYDALSPEFGRVLENGGTVEITGGMSNKWFNRIYKMSEEQLDNLGYKLIFKGEAVNPDKGMTTSGEEIKSKIMEIILRKK